MISSKEKEIILYRLNPERFYMSLQSFLKNINQRDKFKKIKSDIIKSQNLDIISSHLINDYINNDFWLDKQACAAYRQIFISNLDGDNSHDMLIQFIESMESAFLIIFENIKFNREKKLFKLIRDYCNYKKEGKKNEAYRNLLELISRIPPVRLYYFIFSNIKSKRRRCYHEIGRKKITF